MTNVDWTWPSPNPRSFDELNGMLNAQMKALENKLAGVQSDLAIFNVKDYGVTGEGLVDDTSAAQAAIDAAEAVVFGSFAGAEVYFPNGAYRFVGGLTVKAHGITLRGETRSNTTLNFESTSIDGITIS